MKFLIIAKNKIREIVNTEDPNLFLKQAKLARKNGDVFKIYQLKAVKI